jgi:exosortase
LPRNLVGREAGDASFLLRFLRSFAKDEPLAGSAVMAGWFPGQLIARRGLRMAPGVRKRFFMLAKPDGTASAIRRSPSDLWVPIAAGLVLLWVFLPTLLEVLQHCASVSRYSHGFLVPLFVVYYLGVFKRDSFPSRALQTEWWGLGLVAGGLLLRFAGIYLYNEWLAGVALLPCLAGLCVLLGGRALLQWAWPGVAFLIFMVPLPYRVEVALAGPLRRIATIGSTYALQTLGFMSFSEGNYVRMGPTMAESLDIAEACSGLSMLLVFFAIATAVIMLIQARWYEKVLIFVSAVPIAVLANIVRLTATGIVLKASGPEWSNYFHDSIWAALLMIALALGLLWIELRALAWIFVPRVAEDATVAPLAAPAKPAEPAAPSPVPSAPSTNIKKAPAAAAAETRKILPGLGLAVGSRPDNKKSTPKGAQ